MQAENWKKVKKVLEEALSLDVSERRSFLSRAEISRETRAEVESLLAFETESEDAMRLSAVEFSKDFFDAGESPNALGGQRVGAYKIVREIGQGGMGAVYLAERADGKFEQKVALKLLKREMNTAALRRRFQREQAILASLEHPNIARLLDTGTTDDGVPYLVMEFVAGEPIDKFCSSRARALNERLKIFNRVCETVAFAHRSLIVHRDLKPSNILVNADGEPKLLDFGISKLLSLEAEEHTLTNFGAMTPHYASPEQIRGETVTTATDIYSLGVVLFKILTGEFPYNFKNKSNGNLLKEITDAAPLRPSVAALSSHKTNPQSAIPNPKSLAGDLDNIILKSLSKEPERRYETAQQFSADVWRFIDGLPVLARPATVAYRARKFYARNRVPVLAVVLIFVSLIAGIFVAASQARAARAQAQIASDAQKQAELETEHARAEEEKAKKITAFMSKIIGYANPAWYAEGAKFGRNARVIDALDDLSDKIDTEFANEPDVAAELHHKFSEVYLMMGKSSVNPTYSEMLGKDDAARLEDFGRKEKFHALRALESRKRFYGEWHELVAKDLFYAYYFLGETDAERAEILMRAIQMMRATNPNNLNLPYMLEAYAGSLISPEYEKIHEPYRKAALPPTGENNYEIAEEFYREALPLFRAYYKDENYATYSNECTLAYALAMQENRKDFDAHYAICKQGEEKLRNTGESKRMKELVAMVEKALANSEPDAEDGAK